MQTKQAQADYVNALTSPRHEHTRCKGIVQRYFPLSKVVKAQRNPSEGEEKELNAQKTRLRPIKPKWQIVLVYQWICSECISFLFSCIQMKIQLDPGSFLRDKHDRTWNVHSVGCIFLPGVSEMTTAVISYERNMSRLERKRWDACFTHTSPKYWIAFLCHMYVRCVNLRGKLIRKLFQSTTKLMKSERKPNFSAQVNH